MASGTLSQRGQHDWLAISLTANQAYLFTITGLTNYAFLEVGTADALSGDGISLSNVPTTLDATAQTQTVWFDPSTSGTYYLDVYDPATVGGYSVSATTVSADYTDNTSTTGVITVNGSATTGDLSQLGQHDWLAVSLNANQAYLFTITGLTNYAFLEVGTADALSGDGVSLSNVSTTLDATAQTQTVWFDPSASGTYYLDVSDPATVGGYSVSATTVSADYTDNPTTTGLVLCFLRGTQIATSDGEMPVERLAVGDLVRARFSGLVPVQWIGRRRVDCRRHPNPRMVWPVRVRANAFGHDSPHRDLWLSPDHAVFVDEVLIPVKHLINGTTIQQVPTDEVTYYHVELPNHDVLVAEGLPTESYLDTGDRANFDNGGGPRRLFPDFSVRAWEAFGCAPLIVTGPALHAVRRRVNARATPMSASNAQPEARAAIAA